MVAYFAKLPPKLVATLSQAKALAMRKALLAAATKALFEEYSSAAGADNPALLGERFHDAYAVCQRVYVRFQNFIFDYPVVAAWSLTKANKVRMRTLRARSPPAQERGREAHRRRGVSPARIPRTCRTSCASADHRASRSVASL